MDNMAHGSGFRVYVVVSVIFCAIAVMALSVLIDIQSNLTVIRENLIQAGLSQCNCPSQVSNESLHCVAVLDLDGKTTDRYVCDVR